MKTLKKKKLDYKYIAILLLFLSISFAFFHGARLPNLWSQNYFIPSFFDGFYRRSLLGTLLSLFGPLKYNYAFTSSLQILTLLALIFVLVHHAINNFFSCLLLAAFFISPMGAYLFHEVGYIDQFLYLSLFLILILTRDNLQIFFLSATIFVHEISALTIIPLFLAYQYQRKDKKHISSAFVSSLISFFFIYSFCQTISKWEIMSYLEMLNTKTDYPVRMDYYSVFTNSFEKRSMNYYTTREVPMIFFMIMYSFIASFSIHTEKNLQTRKKRLLVFLSGLTPLVLGLYGWDTDRFIFLSGFSTTIILLLNFQKTNKSLIVLITAILLSSTLILNFKYFDGYFPANSLDEFIRNITARPKI